MTGIRYTLVSDGPTDANLIPIIDWTLRNAADVSLPEGTRAEFWRLTQKPKTLAERLLKAIELSPSDLLFVHRDAECEPYEKRSAEILDAFEEASERGLTLPVVAVIPIRMSEAWLCFDSYAIRCASGNPNSSVQLSLPALNRIESRPDPKADLSAALLAASELTGRRRKKFNTAAAFWRIVDFIEDFSPLRELSAFRSFESSVQRLKTQNWNPGLYF